MMKFSQVSCFQMSQRILRKFCVLKTLLGPIGRKKWDGCNTLMRLDQVSKGLFGQEIIHFFIPMKATGSSYQDSCSRFFTGLSCYSIRHRVLKTTFGALPYWTCHLLKGRKLTRIWKTTLNTRLGSWHRIEG